MCNQILPHLSRVLAAGNYELRVVLDEIARQFVQ